LDREAKADQEAKLLLDYLVSNVQQLGGDNVRPWAAVAIDDDSCSSMTVGSVTVPACASSDRLHILMLGSEQQCEITNVTGSVVSTTPNAADPAHSCIPTSRQGENLVLINGLGQWRSARCNNVTATAGTNQCTMAAGQSSFNPAGGVDASYIGGTIAVGKVFTYFLDQSTQTLMLLSDTDDDGSPELSEVADHIYDFQVEYGLDVDGNGVVETFTGAYGVNPIERLRMLRLGLIVGVPAPSRDSSAQESVLGGTAKTTARGVYLHPAVAKATLRNLLLFY
jgi:hypothetical protein